MADINYTNYLGQMLASSATAHNAVTGTTAAEVLAGTSAADAIISNGGADTMIGGAGDDTYVVYDTRAVVVENPGGGVDTVRTIANYVLPDNVENLTVTGFTGKNGTTGIGNSLDNVIVGDSNAQTLDGRGGNDVLTGGGGGDTFVFEKNSGHDVVTDFHTGGAGDIVSLQDYGYQSFSQIQSNLSQVGSDVLLKLDSADDVLFRNTTVTSFTAANFHFALPDLSGVKTSFDDEFNGTSLNTYNVATKTGVWSTEFGFGGWGTKSSHEIANYTGEQEIFVDSSYAGAGKTALGLNPFSEQNGVLNISAGITPSADVSALYGFNYYAGLITTSQTFAQTYGYFEIRAKMPDAQGAWPAFWMVPKASGYAPQEIDIYEEQGGSPGVAHETVHDASLAGTAQGGTSYVDNATTQFHTYGVLWDPQHLTFFTDGRETYQMATPADMHQAMYLMANVAVGAWAGTPSATSFSPDMQVDYIRAYSLADVTAAQTAQAAVNLTVQTAPPVSAPGAPSSGNALNAGASSSSTSSGSDAPATSTPPPPPNSAGVTLSGTTLKGGAGNDVLHSTAATATLAGGAGDDTYYVDHAGASVVEALNAGHDKVITTLVNYTLPTNVEDLTYAGGSNFSGTGNVLANVITGGAGNDTLNGGGGGDTLVGGAGNDTYYVTSSHDVVTEAAGGGTDVVYTSVNWSVTAGSEIEKLVGTVASLNLTGNGHAMEIDGNSGQNVIDDGGAADTLVGGGGNDTYLVHNAGTVVTELAGGGYDTVKTTLNAYTTPDQVEVLTFTGTGNFHGVGNALSNLITGGDGNDTLDGGAGADRLVGGKGDDTYIVDNAGDTVVENPGEGRDTVLTTLNAYAAPANVEVVTFIGTGNFVGYANATGVSMTGGAGNDWLHGGAGADTLAGAGGNDTLTGGGGADTFVLNAPGAGVNRITDFASGSDHLVLKASDFGLASLSNVAFVNGAASTAGGPSLDYDAKGNLYFDSVGGDPAHHTLIAAFDSHPALHLSDFVLG